MTDVVSIIHVCVDSTLTPKLMNALISEHPTNHSLLNALLCGFKTKEPRPTV